MPNSILLIGPSQRFRYLIDAVCTALIAKRHGNLRSRLLESKEMSLLHLRDLRDMEAEMRMEWLAGFAGA